MGKVKRRKQLKGFGEESRAKNVKISLGAFLSTSESSSFKQDPRFKKANIIISEQCMGFAIDDFRIAGLAFPSEDEKGVVVVGI